MQSTHLGLFDTGAATHVGRVRHRNEDSYLTRPETGIWAVADGMGGHESGDLASQTVIAALRTIDRRPRPPTSCRIAIACPANDRLRGSANSAAASSSAQRSWRCSRSTTTTLALVRRQPHLHGGRNRPAVARPPSPGSGGARHDHAKRPRLAGRNIITRAIGVYDDPELEITSGLMLPGDRSSLQRQSDHPCGRRDLIVRTSVSQQACDSRSRWRSSAR